MLEGHSAYIMKDNTHIELFTQSSDNSGEIKSKLKQHFHRLTMDFNNELTSSMYIFSNRHADVVLVYC